MKNTANYLILFFLTTCSVVSAQWTAKQNGLPVGLGTSWAIDACDSSTAVISCNINDGKAIFYSIDQGNKWSKISLPSLSDPALDLSIIDKSHFWAATSLGKILYTSDTGNNWTVQYYDTNRTGNMNYIKMFDLMNGIAMGDAKNNSDAAVFLKTSDGGKNWISVNDSAFGGYSGDIWRRINFVNSNTGYFFESGSYPQKLFKTINGGNKWEAVNFPDSSLQVINFYDENYGLAVTLDHIDKNCKIYRTQDGGILWGKSVLNARGWPNSICFIPGNCAKVWFTDYEKLYFSNDSGKTWTENKLSNNSPVCGRDLIFTDKNHGWFLCDNGIVYHYSDTGGSTSTINNEDNRYVKEYSLLQNYPNPFNPVTTISYYIPTAGEIALKVYDLLGQQVSEIVNAYQNAGWHEVKFDASKLASEIYIYQLKAGTTQISKKFTLVK